MWLTCELLGHRAWTQQAGCCWMSAELCWWSWQARCWGSHWHLRKGAKLSLEEWQPVFVVSCKLLHESSITLPTKLHHSSSYLYPPNLIQKAWMRLSRMRRRYSIACLTRYQAQTGWQPKIVQSFLRLSFWAATEDKATHQLEQCRLDLGSEHCWFVEEASSAAEQKKYSLPFSSCESCL